MALREIRRYPDEILRKKSKPVERVDETVRQLLRDMTETMYHTQRGSGLAACQVGVLRRLVVADVDGVLYQLVNPVLKSYGGEQRVQEGCLSFPGVWGLVRRPERVLVEALNEWGEPVMIRGRGPLAQCLCHEIEHLDGIVFTQHVERYLQA